MHLQKLEMVGFKSFADRTELDFLPPSDTSKGITAIVGPNGSGKSNVADAIRWVLGEQSAKTLRGKKAEDVIFSGSERRQRSSFAEVTMILNNEDGKLPIEGSEVSITRRVYRDGESEYLINRGKVRLTDIQLLLAQAQFSARSYSVIGQGMTDVMLVATPLERKEFLDEAAGVRQYQLKRNQSVQKMDQARENLAQAEMLLAEIEPRLRSLHRQVKRLETKDQLEQDLHAQSHEYYGKLWFDLKKLVDERQSRLDALEGEWKSKESIMAEARQELKDLEEKEAVSEGLAALQANYERLIEERAELRQREMEVRSRMEVATQVRRQTAGAMPLTKIIQEIGGVADRQSSAIDRLKSSGTLEAAKETVPEFEAVRDSAAGLRDRLERPATEAQQAPADPALIKELEAVRAAVESHEEKVRAAQAELHAYSQAERGKKEKFFSLQRAIEEKIAAAHALERRLGDERVEMARLETRRDTLNQEMAAELGERSQHIKDSYQPTGEENVEALAAQIQRLKYQLNLIGGIDPEAVREYQETNSRHEFLLAQVTDLKKAIEDLDRVIAELDLTIKARSESAFRQINRDFDRYFKSLFGGGRAELIQLFEEPTEGDENSENGDLTPSGAPAQAGAPSGRPKAAETKPKKIGDQVVGIEIVACPPNKKIKNIAMLSGGERALTAIALICAIMASNPSPFVVLDEVDAALDESNADKFANIVSEMAAQSQFIVVTHNRYTMTRSNILYGVTMADDGTSKLLSVNLEQVGGLKNQARQKVAV